MQTKGQCFVLRESNTKHLISDIVYKILMLILIDDGNGMDNFELFCFNFYFLCRQYSSRKDKLSRDVLMYFISFNNTQQWYTNSLIKNDRYKQRAAIIKIPRTL